MNKKIEFEAIFKKADLFSETLHIIVFPKGSLTEFGKICDIKENQKLRITLDLLKEKENNLDE
jgi:hypothetical protein